MSTEKGRLAAHVLLDAVSVMREGGEEAEPSNLAYQRLVDIEAFSVDVTENEDGTLLANVELSQVLGATLVTIGWLAEELSAASGETRDEVILRLRDFLDNNFGDAAAGSA